GFVERVSDRSDRMPLNGNKRIVELFDGNVVMS
uniref:Protein kinase domain-containing protein n=1 Tax=Parascaris univalens TaxID=6257 RepID=A0A915BGU1_PARUN